MGSRGLPGYVLRIVALTGVVAAAGVVAQEQGSEAAPGASVATETAAEQPAVERRIDETAARYMRAACEYLEAQKAFSVHGEATLEEVFRSGRRIQHSRGLTVTFRRPDRLRADIDFDKGRREFFYDGRSVVITDVNAKVYGRFDAPPTTEAMLDDAMARFNVAIPLADLVSADPCGALENTVQRGWYLGEHYFAGGRYHHLLFSAPDVDLQVWVTGGEAPLFRKFVLRYKNEPGEPQYGVALSDWNFAPAVDDANFSFSPPADAHRIEFVVAAAPGGEAPADAGADAPAAQE
ncbi:MAG: hypothetical protein NFCOHLIN_03182 [Gammaproteobacteria bacterium]|nr:hypothetical protein [Gammaproteobacteria bacterium]